MGYCVDLGIYFGCIITKDDVDICKLIYENYLIDIEDDCLLYTKEYNNYYDALLHILYEYRNIELKDNYSINMFYNNGNNTIILYNKSIKNEYNKGTFNMILIDPIIFNENYIELKTQFENIFKKEYNIYNIAEFG